MSNNKKNSNFVSGCLGALLGITVAFFPGLSIATKVMLYFSECNPPNSDCNGMVAFARAMSYGSSAFILVTTAGGIIGVVIAIKTPTE